MRSVFLIVIFAISLAACRNSSCDPKDLEKQHLANQVRRKSALKIKQETGLRPCGTIGQMLNEIQVLGLSFDYYKSVDIAEGRKLLVKAIDVMLDEVNQEKKIHPYLIRYPFLPRNIEIAIFLRSPQGHDVTPGSLWIVESCEGLLRYRIDHPETKKLTTVYQETYEEALERIKDPSLPLVPFKSDAPRKISQEEEQRLRQGISLVTDDGSIYHLDASGQWIKDSSIQK